jgi:cyclopropane fatty-acyl-phospholipid synthase-like methyltransferase
MTSQSSLHSDKPGQVDDEVKAFFDGWTIYEKAMNANYFGHNQVYGALHGLLMSEFLQGFSLIDFGCGDASFMAAALKGTAIEKYVGVDLSGTALDMARKRMKDLSCDRVFVEGHFSTVVEELELHADIIWVGLNLHHLPLIEKDRFFGASRKLLNPDGSLILFEPMCLAGEDRAGHAKRWWKACQRKWTALSRPEMESLRDHIFSADYPETFETVDELARRHGFRRVMSMFRDPDQLYEMVRLAF